MSARKLIYRFMVLAPAIFLVGIGVHARTLPNDFETVANGPITERAILEYVPFLRQACDFDKHYSKAKPAEARRLAVNWIEAAESGRLRALTPVAFEDTSSEGAKSQIFETKGRIVRKLLSSIGNEVSRDPRQAIADATLVVKLSEILKYSDFISLFNSSTDQRRAIQQVGPAFASIPADERRQFADLLRNTACKPQEINSMLERSRRLFLSWRDRQGDGPLSPEDAQFLSEIPVMVKNDELVAMRQLKDRIVACKDEAMPEYCSSVRLGAVAQHALDEQIRASITELEKSEVPR